LRRPERLLLLLLLVWKHFRLAVGKSALESNMACSSPEVFAQHRLEVAAVKQLSFIVGKAALKSKGAYSSILVDAPPRLVIAEIVVIVIMVVVVVVVISDRARIIEACRFLLAEGARLIEACTFMHSADCVERLSWLLLLLEVSRCCCCYPKAGPPSRGLGFTRDDSNKRASRLGRREGRGSMTVGFSPGRFLRDVHGSYGLDVHLRI
jgi:hypothetical protein